MAQERPLGPRAADGGRRYSLRARVSERGPSTASGRLPPPPLSPPLPFLLLISLSLLPGHSPAGPGMVRRRRRWR